MDKVTFSRARQLADLAGGRTVHWSDTWTDEDLAEATASAVRNFEDSEREPGFGEA